MASILSGRRCGHKGVLTYTPHGDDSQEPISDHDIFDWRLSMRRRPVEITEVNQSVKEFWYTHAEAIVDFKAYINQGELDDEEVWRDYPPGAFNQTEPATIRLWPDGLDFPNRWTMEGWVEEMRVEVSIGTPNILIGKIRVTGDVTQFWQP